MNISSFAVVGTNTWNKGAELMQVAVDAHFADYKRVQLAVPRHFGSFEERSRHGLRLMVQSKLSSRQFVGLTLLPMKLKEAAGILMEKDVDAVLDASGFAFGDQHPLKRAEEFARNVRRWKKQGKAIILLPQALGPFSHPDTKAAFAEVLENVDLVYARESQSFKYARGIGVATEKIKQAPDFTSLVKPLMAEQVASLNRACIVPNQRMIEKAESKVEADSYIPMLAESILAVEANGLEAVLLVHGVDDKELVNSIQKQVGKEIDCIAESDPTRIKAELGLSKLVIGSRFHALVSALTQGVPVIATSWSHKYRMLLEEFQCSEYLVSSTGDRQAVHSMVNALNSEYESIACNLKRLSEQQDSRVRRMWDEVDGMLGV